MHEQPGGEPPLAAVWKLPAISCLVEDRNGFLRVSSTPCKSSWFAQVLTSTWVFNGKSQPQA